MYNSEEQQRKKNNLLKKKMKRKLITRIGLSILSSVTPTLLLIFGVIIIAGMVLMPIFSSINYIKGLSDKLAGIKGDILTFYEKSTNFLFWGRGFQLISAETVKEKEEEFNKKLAEEYYEFSKQDILINVPVILATAHYALEDTYDEKAIKCYENTPESKEYCDQIGIDYNQDRFDEWANKIKKLDKLISNGVVQVVNEYKCDPITSETGETYYIQGERLSRQVKGTFDGDFTESEKCISNSNITVYEYEWSKDNYDKYLKEEYIINSPEFRIYEELTEEEKNTKIDQIIFNIYDIAKLIGDNFDYSNLNAFIYGSLLDGILGYLIPPIEQYRITSCFSPYRVLPNGYVDAHRGIDLTNNIGNRDVFAAADGKVIKVDSDNNYNCFNSVCAGQDARGNYVIIEHNFDGARYITQYFHLEQVKTSEGSKVKAGDVIGTWGNTGLSSGAHLHFQINDSSNVAINPGNLFTNPVSVSPNAGCDQISTTCSNLNDPATVNPVMGKWDNKSYPITVSVNKNAPIPLEQYVLGVTLKEAYTSFDIEAIKAQMIASRTYTLASHAAKSFNVINDKIVIDVGVAGQETQDYDLNSFCNRTNDVQNKFLEALKDTRGKVLVNSGEMFSSEYSSCAENDKYKTLEQGFVYVLPGNKDKVAAFCEDSNCQQNGQNICGHGRGMSQKGANYLAEDLNYSYDRILDHYYDANVTSLKDINLTKYKK